MAKTYFGVQDLPKILKKLYIGDNDVAKTSKKVYVGDSNGIAQTGWSGKKEVRYYGTATPLSDARMRLCGATCPDDNSPHVLFTGGVYNSTTKSIVDVYDSTLTRSQLHMESTHFDHAMASCADGVYIYAGANSASNSTVTNYMDSYTPSLTHSGTTHGTKRRALAGCGCKSQDFVAFAGGCNYSYSSWLTQVDGRSIGGTFVSLPLMTVGRQRLQGAYAEDTLLFAGGQTSGACTDSIETYSHTGTKTSTLNLSTTTRCFASASSNEYALFAGGENVSGNIVYIRTFVNIFDGALTRQSLTNLVEKRYDLCATYVDGYFLVGGGDNGVYQSASDYVDIYDSSFTHTVQQLSKARYNLACASIGNKALFAGGYRINEQSMGVYYADVDVFEVA